MSLNSRFAARRVVPVVHGGASDPRDRARAERQTPNALTAKDAKGRNGTEGFTTEGAENAG